MFKANLDYKQLIKSPWVISFVMVSIQLMLVWSICPISFETNDDKRLMYLFAGYNTGNPTPASGFSGYLWGVLITTFYKICAELPWYTILCQVVIFSALWVICYGLINSLKKNSLVEGVVISVLLFWGAFVFYTDVIQFTVTASFCGLAACSIVILGEFYESVVNRVLLLACMLLFAVNIRKNVGYMAIVCCVISVTFLIIIKGYKKEYTYIVATIVACILLSVGADLLFEKNIGMRDYREFQEQLGQYIDYDHVLYEENAELYEQIGWDESLYNITAEWFFMDERFTTSALKVINTANNYSKENYSLGKLYSFFRGENFLLGQLIVIGLLELIISIYLRTIRGKIAYRTIILFALMDIMFCFYMIWFACIKGRMNGRACETGIFMFVVVGLLWAYFIYCDVRMDRAINKIMILGYIISFVILVVLNCIPYVGLFNKVYRFSHDANKVNKYETVAKLEDYAINNPDNIYIYDLSLSSPTYPYIVYKDEKPINVFMWGGGFYESPMYYEQLKANNLTHLYSDKFLDENVYICGTKVNEELLIYMKKKIFRL